MHNKAISVSIFNNYINNIIASEEMLVNIAITGEICDLSINKGIAYFSIKDENALLSCVCFFEPVFCNLKNGTQAIIVGSPQFYVKGGKFNFKVCAMHEIGKGALHEEFLRLKEKLEKKGYFAPEHKKPLPRYASKIGVVSSIDGAVIKDICSVVRRRNPYINIVLYNAGVQGQKAECEICEGIKELDKLGLDTIIIARGGGSSEDLAVFNSEKIADTIFNANTPVISAIGHETDFTICDFVASVRAPTPSVAAEIAVFDFNGAVLNFKKAFDNVFKCAVNETESKINKVCGIFDRLSYAVFNKIEEAEHKLKVAEVKLAGKNPLEILKQGYAVVNKKFDEIKQGDTIKITLQKGSLAAVVAEKENVK